jgi:hypothetical protein
MKLTYFLATLALFTGAIAQAQTSSVTTIDTSGAQGASSVGTSTATSAASLPDDGKVKPVIRYLGYMHGVGLDFSGAHEAGINDNSQMTYEQRVKFLLGFSKDIEAGVEVRENTNFGNGQNAGLTNGSWRIHSAFKNVLNSEVYNLTLMPRLLLPTANKYHNQKATVSPDPMIEFAITPRNSRFTIDSGVEYIYFLHTAGATGADYTNADTAIVAPWLEVDYQLTQKTQLMLSYWPELNAHARENVPLNSNWSGGGGNEFDAGGYYEFVKGWQINPYIATEMSNIGANNSSIAKNLQFNFLLIGKVL